MISEKKNRYSITLYTPGKLDRLTPDDWDTLSRVGFPVYLYDVASIQMQRLQGEQEVPACQASPLPLNTSKAGATKAPKSTSANAASSSNTPEARTDPWKNIPLPSIVVASEQTVMDPEAFSECCKCARALNQEYYLPVGECTVGMSILRTLEYHRMIMEELDELSDAAKTNNWVEVTSMDVMCMTQIWGEPRSPREFILPSKAYWYLQLDSRGRLRGHFVNRVLFEARS